MKLTAIVGLLALVSWSAQSAEVPGWRVGAALSYGSFKGKSDPNAGLDNKFIEDDAVGGKLYGQYQFNSWLGVEGAYHDTAQFEENTDSGKLKLSFQGFSLQGLIYVPVPSEEIQAYLKAGYFDFNDDLSLNDVTHATSSETGLVVGGGAIIQIADRVGVRLDYDWFNADVGDLWAFNLGVEYYFGGTEKAEAEPVAMLAPRSAPPPRASQSHAESRAATGGDTAK